MISKIIGFLNNGFQKFSKELNCGITDLSLMIRLNTDPVLEENLEYWIYKSGSPIRKITFWEAIDREGKIRFIDYEMICGQFIFTRILSYESSYEVPKEKIYVFIHSDKDGNYAATIFGENNRIESLKLKQLFE